MDWTGWLKAGVLLVFAGYLLYATVCVPPRFLSWPMFAEVNFARFTLWCDSGRGPERVDHWRHLVLFDSYHDLLEVDAFLSYLTRQCRMDVNGEVIFVDRDGTHRLEVNDGSLDY